MKHGRVPLVGLCHSFISVYVPGVSLPGARALAFPVPRGPEIIPGRQHGQYQHQIFWLNTISLGCPHQRIHNGVGFCSLDNCHRTASSFCLLLQRTEWRSLPDCWRSVHLHGPEMLLTAASGSESMALRPPACCPFPDGSSSAMQNTPPEGTNLHSGGNLYEF